MGEVALYTTLFDLVIYICPWGPIPTKRPPELKNGGKGLGLGDSSLGCRVRNLGCVTWCLVLGVWCLVLGAGECGVWGLRCGLGVRGFWFVVRGLVLGIWGVEVRV